MDEGGAEVRARPAGRQGRSPAVARTAAAVLAALPPERAAAQSRVLAWFTPHRDRRRTRWSTGSGTCSIAASLVGVIAAFARRNRPATSLLPIPLALAALYVLFFAEARYHLPVAVLLMPFAGAGLVWVGEAVRDLARFTIDRQRRPRLLYRGGAGRRGDRRCSSSAGRGCWRRGRACGPSTAGRPPPAASTAPGRCAGSGRAGAGASRRPCAAPGTVSGFA